jgi:hypothetical protein
VSVFRCSPSKFAAESSRCQDCDAELGVNEDGMEVDGQLTSDEATCRQCRRVVCDFCAVECLELRRCFGCVSR